MNMYLSLIPSIFVSPAQGLHTEGGVALAREYRNSRWWIFAGFFTAHDPTRAGRVRNFFKSHGSGRVGSGDFQTLTDRVGTPLSEPTGYDPARPTRFHPTCEQPLDICNYRRQCALAKGKTKTGKKRRDFR